MRTAAEYAELAEAAIARSWSHDDRQCMQLALMDAQAHAILANAAATLEAAALTHQYQAACIAAALAEPEPDGVAECPGCGCMASIDRADGLVCEEYPGCAALMEPSDAQ